MPRKTLTIWASLYGSIPCFNEAAARCRGKRIRRWLRLDRFKPASMRPRPDAAENLPRRDSVGPRPPNASMRPRPDAAENTPEAGDGKLSACPPLQ